MPERWESDASDEQLVIEAMKGDGQVQARLWQAHRPWLAVVLYSYKPQRIDVEDLMQDVAVKFLKRIHTLREPAAFRSWLRRIAINAAREAARSPQQRTASLDAIQESYMTEPEEKSTHRNQREQLTTHDEAHRLLELAMTLPSDYREPLLLRSVRGMRCKEIAHLLDLPITTVETRLVRARKMLRDEWSDREKPSTPTVPPIEVPNN